MGCWLKAPKIGGQCAKLLAQFQRSVCIVYRRADLALVPNDAGIEHQPFNICLVKLRHLLHIESSESLPESLTLVQDGQPAQACLKALKTDFLKKAAVITDRKSPFLIVVMLVGVGCSAPDAATNIMVICKKSRWSYRQFQFRRATVFVAHVSCPFVANTLDLMVTSSCTFSSWINNQYSHCIVGDCF